MADALYKRIKRRNGEKFAQTLRNHHSGILEIPDIDRIVRYAGRDATPILPYLVSLLARRDDDHPGAASDPFKLLEQAGYDAFHADTLDKQNSIMPLFKKSELLCTFNDAARFRKYHIVHAIKKGAADLERSDFDGNENRQDAYGTSVISIQMLKSGGFISIKNRYNHTVSGCDNTFNSNPDNIIAGLSLALKTHFDVDYAQTRVLPSDDYALIDNQLFHYNFEINNALYGDQCWAHNGIIHPVNQGNGDALFDTYLFDNKTKTLSHATPGVPDSFPDDFNRTYGGNPALAVDSAGNLTLDGSVLIGAHRSRITSLSLPGLTSLGRHALKHADHLERFSAPDLLSMGDHALCSPPVLTAFEAPALRTMGQDCLHTPSSLSHFEAPSLTAMAGYCLSHCQLLSVFRAPSLISMGVCCLRYAYRLSRFEAPLLLTMQLDRLHSAASLEHFEAPSLTTMKPYCLFDVPQLSYFHAPSLQSMGAGSLRFASGLPRFQAPSLVSMGDDCLRSSNALTHFAAPSLITMGHGCVYHVPELSVFLAPSLQTLGENCLKDAPSLTQFEAPLLHSDPFASRETTFAANEMTAACHLHDPVPAA